MKLKLFHWVDGPPDMCIDSGFYWQLEDANGKIVAQSNESGFESMMECRGAALTMPFDWKTIEIVELGKFNPDEPDEYVDGVYSGKYG